eukprot:TRINITY_DN10202_c0_g1_i1.p1 TRINITY_DN10202_c0_g1~~TRINITY_DN10202_c0_g1_i1.p1  ORF type:complete len:279 (+),score=46.16 TRINITY_DN10202_c0_g1_i1:42-878(+)
MPTVNVELEDAHRVVLEIGALLHLLARRVPQLLVWSGQFAIFVPGLCFSVARVANAQGFGDYWWSAWCLVVIYVLCRAMPAFEFVFSRRSAAVGPSKSAKELFTLTELSKLLPSVTPEAYWNRGNRLAVVLQLKDSDTFMTHSLENPTAETHYIVQAPHGAQQPQPVFWLRRHPENDLWTLASDVTMEHVFLSTEGIYASGLRLMVCRSRPRYDSNSRIRLTGSADGWTLYFPADGAYLTAPAGSTDFRVDRLLQFLFFHNHVLRYTTQMNRNNSCTS